MRSILNYLILLNLIILTMCICMFFIETGLQIHISNFDLNISPFGLYVIYAIFTMFIVFVNIYYIIQLKLHRNKQRVKFARFLDEFNELKKKYKADDILIDMPTRQNVITNDAESYVEDANYEQLRLLFSN